MPTAYTLQGAQAKLRIYDKNFQPVLEQPHSYPKNHSNLISKFSEIRLRPELLLQYYSNLYFRIR